MLEEMDAEFGIGGLIEQEFGTKKKKVKSIAIQFLHLHGYLDI